MEIIDFHTHPFVNVNSNICAHKEYFEMTPDNAVEYLKKIGITKICGSIVYLSTTLDEKFDDIIERNNHSLELREKYGDFYVPGMNIHPDYVKESLQEIERMHNHGINLIGELVPYLDKWTGQYDSDGLFEILELADHYNMVVSVHTMFEESMDKMIERFKNITFVGAHPDELAQYKRHIERMKKYDNYYLDLSGTGLFRHGMLMRGIKEVGVDRILFGTDFPTCNPSMFVGGVVLEPLLSDGEKEAILSKNAKRILGL